MGLSPSPFLAMAEGSQNCDAFQPEPGWSQGGETTAPHPRRITPMISLNTRWRSPEDARSMTTLQR